MMMTYEKMVLPTSITAALVVTAIASIGLAGEVQKAFASVEDSTTMTNDTTTTTAETGAAAANASKMNGVIASMQLDENGNPAWITAGHWNLESDIPLIGGGNGGDGGGGDQTEPQVSNFTATIYMVSNADGTAAHMHEVSNFTQTGVTHQGPNSTTVNGTFTITLEEGPVNNVSGYVHVINDKIEFWVDPVTTDNHFGPTTITGVVLTPEKFGGDVGRSHEGIDMMMTTNTQQ
jgi:hypothetical protein